MDKPGSIHIIQRCPPEDALFRYAERTLPEDSHWYLYIALHLRRCERCRQHFKEYLNREVH